eukprot:CCRYP_011465-RA/>CCRYP_011465-RA protein AED:0.74 eAED:0.74 QI:0/0/0/0.33/1/1/3/0/118
MFSSPRSKNCVAYKALWWPADKNTPRPTDCPQCLNKGGASARCGLVGDRNYNSQKWCRHDAVCPIDPGETATQACFDKHPLTFVADNLYGAVPDQTILNKCICHLPRFLAQTLMQLTV